MTLPVLASDPGQIDQVADPVGYVILACERAKTWLTHALEHGQIEDIVELKSQAEAIRVYTAQKQIGHDAELAAAEVVRRAERGIGVAIRRGQEAGVIAKRGDIGARPAAGFARGGLSGSLRGGDLVKPSSFGIAATELTDGPYALADGVSDEAFEAAITSARAEENLTRKNVVRKARAAKSGEQLRDLSTPAARRQAIRELAEEGYSSRQIAGMVGLSENRVRYNAREMGLEIPADRIIGNSHRHDSNRIVEETVHALDGLRMGVELIDYSALDRDKVSGWSSSLTASLKSLNQLARRLKELDQP